MCIFIREYPCDHYTAIINVTLLNTGCPRSIIHETALQLLQILDKRFFGSEAFGKSREYLVCLAETPQGED